MVQTERPLRVLLVADMRLPHSLGWLSGLFGLGIDVCVQSTRRLSESDRQTLAARVDMSQLRLLGPSDPWNQLRPLFASRSRASGGSKPNARQGMPGTGLVEAPVELATAGLVSRRVARLERDFAPNVVHALRIPYEGVAAALARPTAALAISIWGQDLIAQAPGNRLLARATMNALRRVDGVHADCQRDLDLAPKWGLRDNALKLLAPGNFGIDPLVFHSGPDHGVRHRFGIPDDSTVILSPRRPAGWVQWREFLEGFSLAAGRNSQLHAVMLATKGYLDAERMVFDLGLVDRVTLLPEVPRETVADLMRTSRVVVSLTTSDGTPNSVLEALACGAFPIVTDVDSLRDVVTEGRGGIVLADAKPESVAEAMLRPVADADYTESVLQFNSSVVQVYRRDRVEQKISAFYLELAERAAFRRSQ